MTRKPMHVDASFENKIKDLQKKIRMKKGEDISLRELTAQIIKDPNFARVEAKLIGKDLSKIDVKLTFDRRLLE